MPDPILPPRLAPGAHVRVVAPSTSMAVVSKEVRAIARRRFGEMQLSVSFGEHVEECDDFASTGVAARVADLHAAFADSQVDAIVTVMGGFNANQLLGALDFDLVAAHPKILCGFSDVTALLNAVLARSGVVTYLGPHYATFGMRDHFGPTLEWFITCLFRSEPMAVQPAAVWSDDRWWVDQSDRHPTPNEGWWVLGEGTARGRLVGGNLCTLNLLQGTPYMPALEGAILFVEDDFEVAPHTFDRDLVSLLQQPAFREARGLVIGRFQRASNVTRDLLARIVRTKPELRDLPVIANVDFGHTDPMLTLPVGGEVTIQADAGGATIVVTRH